MIFLFNKSESMDDKKILHIMNNLKIEEVENCLDISALTGKNLVELKQLLQERFYGKIE
jgi:50S ribosomal subunit-associated GTPase HflX